MNEMCFKLFFEHFANTEENILVLWCDDKARVRGMRPEMREKQSRVRVGEERDEKTLLEEIRASRVG